MNNYVIDQILKNRQITDYLASKGIYPVGHEINGKYRYRCPIHQGDRTPSFFVYLNGEFQNYYCFACHSKYHIIHLYRELEGVSTGEAIRILGGDLNLNLDAEISHAVSEIENDRSLNAEYTPPELSLKIGRMLYHFLERVEGDSHSLKAITKIEELIDKSLYSCDFETLKSLYENLPETLVKAIQKYDFEKEQKFLKNLEQNFPPL